jgi:hypothetical protein
LFQSFTVLFTKEYFPISKEYFPTSRYITVTSLQSASSEIFAYSLFICTFNA